MKFLKFEVGPFLENTYLLIRDGSAILVDPGFSNDQEFNQFTSALDEHNAVLQDVLLTHAHVDHLLGLPRVLDRFESVEVYLNDSDLTPWQRFPEQAEMFGIDSPGFDFIPYSLNEQKGFSLEPFTMDVLYTPGHAPDHVSLYFEDEKTVIAGDTLFRQSIGRTDLYKGNFELLAKSIREKLYTLPDDTRVLSGHGPETTIGYEKVNNQFVKG